MSNILVIDIETGGLDPQKDAIVQVAMIEADLSNDGIFKIHYAACTFVQDPGRAISDETLALTGISRADIAGGLPVDDVLAQVRRSALGNPYRPILAAHNAHFDLGFLRARGLDLRAAIDTMWLSRWMFPYKSASLKSLCERLGVENAQAHDAMSDASATLACLAALTARKGAVPTPIGWDRLEQLTADFDRKMEAARAKKQAKETGAAQTALF